MSTPVSSMMKTQVWSVGMDDTVQEVEAFMSSHGLSWVPMREPGGAVVGVVSATDLLQFHVRKGDPGVIQAWQICTYKPIAVAPDTAVSEVARLMLHNKIHHVVVMETDRIVGVVSSLDFVRQFT
jgi:signal-transduction protein with cAMP-binding, CBS, and nucleotidyltransferase domain